MSYGRTEFYAKKISQVPAGAPLTYFNDRGPSDFLGRKFWLKVIFLGLWKTPGFFWVAKKGLRDFFAYAKKVAISWVDKFLSCDFFGYKILTSVGLPPPPPSLKFVSGAPGYQVLTFVNIVQTVLNLKA